MDKKRKAIALISVLPNAGHLSVAMIYITMGLLVGLVALGVRGRAPDLRESILVLKGQPLGPVLLLVLAACAICLAIWRGLQAFADLDERGKSFIGLCRRGWQLVGGLIYGGLAVLVLRILMNAPTPSGEETARETASKLVIHPFGWFLIFAAGIGVGIAGVYYFSRAVRGNFHGLFRCEQMSKGEKTFCFLMGRIGFAARGLILCVVGYVVSRAGYEVNPWGVGGQATALNTMMAQPLGPWVLGLTALGLTAFGLFYLTIARFGNIPEQRLGEMVDEIHHQHEQLLRKAALSRLLT